MARTESWVYFWAVLGAVVVLHTAQGHFHINPTPVSFDKALEACKPAGGFLANIASQTEVSAILAVVADALGLSQQNQMVEYWIGLKVGREECTVRDQPLRGFKWTATGSDRGSDYMDARWKQEPKETCTGTRCALLSVDFNGTAVIDWGLRSSSCQHTHPYLCREGQEGQNGQVEASCTPMTNIPEAINPSPSPDVEGKLTVECFNGEVRILVCSGDTWVYSADSTPAATESICPPIPPITCTAGMKNEFGNCVDIDECATKTHLCKSDHNCINTLGSYECYCFDPQGNIHSEGSPACSGATTAPPEIILASSPGVVEANSPAPKITAPERHSTTHSPAGSFLPEATASPSEGSKLEVEETAQSSVLIPVLIAVLILVVLVVVVLVVVKCCLRRRSRKLAMKKAERMAMKDTKENRLNGQDSLDHTNEKE